MQIVCGLEGDFSEKWRALESVRESDRVCDVALVSLTELIAAKDTY